MSAYHRRPDVRRSTVTIQKVIAELKKGATLRAIERSGGPSRQTIKNWAKTSPELRAALEERKQR